jgi:hypothetical protein
MNQLTETPRPTLQPEVFFFRKMTRPASILAALLFTVGGLLAPAASGQGITGTITGVVTDSTGATVPGAKVTVIESATNATHTVTTSDVGSYTVTQLPPGKYTVKVDKATFKSYRQNDVTLSIDQVEQINAELTVGATTDTVEVTSAEPVIQTSDSSVGQVLEAQAIQNTPLNGRLSIVGLIALAPGVQGSGAQDQLATRGVTAAVGTGGRNAYGGLGSTLDGVTNQEVTLQRGEGEVPSLDAIAEAKVLTTGAPAEFNQPAQIIVVSASGTNTLHGEVFEYNRSKGTGAKALYLGTATPPARPPYQRNEYGGNLSGPVFIPKLYDGRDKTFFFFAFEGFRLTQSYTDNTAQPSILERQGNFTEFASGSIKDPLTGLPFAGNIIPTARFNSVDLQLLNLLYPTPTQSGTGINTFEQVAETSHSTRFSLRLDHRLDDKNQFRFTFLRAFYGPSPTNGSDSLQGGNSSDGEHNTNSIIGWTHTFSPTLLIDTYASYFHLPIYRTPQNVNTNFSSIIPGLGPELIQGAPQITIAGITKVSESGSKDLEQVIQANTALTKVLPKHTIKAGFGYLYDNHWNDSASSPQRGSFTFSNGQYTGNAVADFLLGYPSQTQNPAPNNYIVKNLSSQYALYVQDDWKPLKNLTVNAGLRYDLQWFLSNPYGENSLYVPAQQKVVVFGSSYPSNAIPGLASAYPVTLSSQVGLPSTVFGYLGQATKNVAPRLGFAYEPIHNTVVRGAFGIYFNLLPASYVGTAPFGNLPFTTSYTYNNTATTPTITMNNPFPSGGTVPPNPSATTQAKTTTPYTEEYNLAIEHQFGHGLDLRVGYVGQHNLKQNNYGGPGNTSPNINLLPQPVLTTGSLQSQYLVQPFSSIGLNLDPIFHSTMNSLQVGVHKQYRNGIAFGAEYQWTRVLGTENIQNPSGATPQDSYGPIGGLTPQVLAVNYSYLLPFGKGQMFLASSGNLIDKIVSGWQLSGITDIQTGQPFSVTYTPPGTYKDPVTGITYNGLATGGNVRASVKPGVPLYPATKTKAAWFNTAAFTAPTNAAGIAGAAYGNSGYNMLRGPGFQDWDMNLQKNILFRERYKVQLRADSFNIFNHPNLGIPVTDFTNSSFGKITSTSSTPSYEQRTVEFAIKFMF